MNEEFKILRVKYKNEFNLLLEDKEDDVFFIELELIEVVNLNIKSLEIEFNNIVILLICEEM